MKNKTKKKSEWRWVYLLTIPIILFGIFCLYAGLNGWFKEKHFTIYEEICRNITNDYSELSGTGCNIGCLYYRKIINGSWDDSTECLNFCDDYLLYHETCEQVEVEEIEICNKTEMCFHYDNGKKINHPCQKGWMDAFCKPINKKDLTLEWLDENCECDECYNKKENWIANREYDENMESYCDYECLKYSCRTYIVEVEK